MLQFFLDIAIRAFVFLPAILGYNFVFGRGKILHFGHVGIGLAATYTVWLLVVRVGQPAVLSLFAGALCALAIGGVLAWLSFRLDPDGLGVMSIAVHLALLAVVLNWQSVTRGALGVPGIPRFPLMETLEGFAFGSFVIAALWSVALWRLDRGRFGRELTALSQHIWHAEALGVRRKRVHFYAFCVAAIGALMTSVLLPSYIRFLGPPDFGFSSMIFIVTCVVAGGPGSLRGVAAATIFLTAAWRGLSLVRLPHDLLGPMHLLLFGFILFLGVCWRRDALFPAKRVV